VNTLIRQAKVAAGLAVVLLAVVGLAKFDDATDGEREIIVTITWKQWPSRPGPGHIDVLGQIGRNGPFFDEATDENPFIESGVAAKGDLVRVEAWAIDGPFEEFACLITGPVEASPPLVYTGLRVQCSAIVT
jgi:hypothetical protein